MIHLSRRTLLIGATAGTVAAGFPGGVVAYFGWCRMIHAFAAPLGRLWPLREAKARHRGQGRATAAGWR